MFGRQLAANPLPQGGGPFRSQVLAIDLQQVGPLVRPVLDEVVAADQPVDHFVALDAGVARVGQKRPDLGGRRRQAGQIEIDAAQEFGVARTGPKGRIFMRCHLAATVRRSCPRSPAACQTKPLRSPITVSVVAA